jgi:hypothetical protein
MPPALTDYTWTFGDDGFVLNTDSLGVPFVDVTGVSGMDTAPQRTTTDEHQGQDGTYIDSSYMSMRTIVVTANLYTDPSDPDELLDRLRFDYNSDVVRPFYQLTPGRPVRYVMASGGGCQYDIDTNRRIGMTPIQLTVLAGDPYIYDYPAQQGQISLATPSDLGIPFDIAFNTGFGGSLDTEGFGVFNNGTHTAYPTFTLYGPLVNPVIRNGNGQTMSFSITLGPTDFLEVDCHYKTVKLNGTASRRSTLAGLYWHSVPAQSDDVYFLSADDGTGFVNIVLSSTYY